ncbi:hypothetical protein QWA_10591 [Alcaligenes faecalis subsp. faecalis NCIB 8687]|jgi:hypothetical protein|nr:hypothetical protein QWA_10591 [Alcaligenes faecalis subsp. faecalis NCIB 8687]
MQATGITIAFQQAESIIMLQLPVPRMTDTAILSLAAACPALARKHGKICLQTCKAQAHKGLGRTGSITVC